MYGIPNCDTIKKARNWFDDHKIVYLFHDYKKQGIDEDSLKSWLKDSGWQLILNKRGTSWRKLDDQTKSNMDDQLAVTVMLDNPSIIKRPLIEFNNKQILGFNEEVYRQEFLHEL